MNSKDVLKRFVELGEEISDEDGEIDEFAREALDVVAQKLSDITQDNLAQLIEDLEQRQKDILGDRELRELSGEELLNYNHIGDLRHQLAAEQVRLTADESFLSWFANNLWPVLRKVGPVVIRILL